MQAFGQSCVQSDSRAIEKRDTGFLGCALACMDSGSRQCAMYLNSYPPVLAAFWPRGSLWCCTVARTAATVCHSCRRHERRRRSLRRRATPPLELAFLVHDRSRRFLWFFWWLWWLWWLWSRRDVYEMSLTICHNSPAPNYWTRAPVDTAPRPVPVYRALKSLTLIPAVKTDSWNLSLRQHSDVPHRRRTAAPRQG